MTIIEFFDEDAVENIASSLLCRPDRVIFVGSNAKKIQRAISNYNKICENRNIKIDFSYKTAPKNDLNKIVAVLCDIIDKADDELFLDIEGGDDLFLVAVGVVSEKYKGKIGLHRYNVKNNTLNDFDADGKPRLVGNENLTATENVMIYGGRVLLNEKAEAEPWDFTAELCENIKTVWEICRKNTSAWNSLVRAVVRPLSETELCGFKTSRELYEKELDILKALNRKGFVLNLSIRDKAARFDLKNEFIKACLLKAGLILELFIAMKAKSLTNDDGNALYNDVMTGVFVAWDEQNDGEIEVENEIDVFLMHGMIPVFISCKNGNVESEELYKLSQVAERFGGKYAKKVLCVSDLDKMGIKADYIRARAEDMKIRIVENIDDISDSSLERALKSLWIN